MAPTKSVNLVIDFFPKEKGHFQSSYISHVIFLISFSQLFHVFNWYPFQTHEEAVTDIIAAEGTMSYKRFPIKLYQVSN